MKIDIAKGNCHEWWQCGRSNHCAAFWFGLFGFVVGSALTPKVMAIFLALNQKGTQWKSKTAKMFLGSVPVDKQQFFTIKSTANKGQNATKTLPQNKVSYSDVSPTKQMWFCTNEKLMTITMCSICSAFVISIQQDWHLIGKIDCTVHMFCHCNTLLSLKSIGMCNIVMEHIVETQLFAPIMCSGLDLASCSLGRTSVRGLELMSWFEFLGWIMGEIALLSMWRQGLKSYAKTQHTCLTFWPVHHQVECGIQRTKTTFCTALKATGLLSCS